MRGLGRASRQRSCSHTARPRKHQCQDNMVSAGGRKGADGESANCTITNPSSNSRIHIKASHRACLCVACVPGLLACHTQQKKQLTPCLKQGGEQRRPPKPTTSFHRYTAGPELLHIHTYTIQYTHWRWRYPSTIWVFNTDRNGDRTVRCPCVARLLPSEKAQEQRHSIVTSILNITQHSKEPQFLKTLTQTAETQWMSFPSDSKEELKVR